MRCLDGDQLFVLGDASPSARLEIDLHLDTCAECRALVTAYLRASEDVDDHRTPFARTLPSEPSPAASDDGLHAGDLIAGRYLLDVIVGEGGISVVWKARDLHSGTHVALKVLKASLPELRGRVVREAKLGTLLSHPNIVEVRAILTPTPGALPILVMDLLIGEPLDRLLERRRVLPAREAIAILLPLASAVRSAHARGVLHRDLKPSNIFLAQDQPGAAPVTMLLDFGLAKLLTDGTEAAMEALTRSGAVLGTPHYMAPEQLYGDKGIDLRADVWAMGAIAYECLTGERPIPGKSYGQIVKNASKASIPPIDPVAHAVPPVLASLVMRMLSHDREQRPWAVEVHEALYEMASSC